MKNFSLGKLSPPAIVMIVVLAYIALQLLLQLINDPTLFLATTVKGLSLGGVYAIIALGFVLIFKATQVLNFAQGALAAAGALFVSFLVFDRPVGDAEAPPGQTPGTWWRAPFAGDGLPEIAQQWASILLIAVLAGVALALLTGKTLPGITIASSLAAFLACRWLATRSGFTWLDNEFLSLVIALAVGFGAGIARGWRPDKVIPIGAAVTSVVLVLVAISDSTWIEWLGNLVIAVILGALFGMALERVAIRPMVGEPLFSMAVITLGLEIAIRQFANDSVKILSRPIQAPWQGDPLDPESDGGFFLGGEFYNWSWIAILITTALAFVGVNAFYRSKLGVAMRAVSFDQEAAMAQGINVGQVFAIAWAFGAGLAVLGGVFASQPPISEEASVTVLTALVAFRALPAVILGGLDSVKGALIGGALIGLAEIYAGQYLNRWTTEPIVWFGQEIIALGAGYQQVVPYIVMLAVLLVRPYGLFGTPEVRRV